MKEIAIIHFLPIEYYPPATNFVTSLLNTNPELVDTTQVYTCHNIKKRPAFTYSNTQTGQLGIHRSPFPKPQDKTAVRLLKYLHFNISSLWRLIKQHPQSILYYETFSAWPVYIYYRYFNRNCRIFIHNHEYASPDWYKKNMKLVKYYHRLEKKWLFPNATWISQTNQDRLKLFHNDHPAISNEVLRVMPNYPPKSWKNSDVNHDQVTPNQPLRIVHIGSLSFHNTYIREFVNWVLQQNVKIQFDVYSYNLASDVKIFLKKHQGNSINFIEEGIEYYHQPALLKNYDVAVILHKAHNENYRFNAPNKLFESLICNLDVWYPQELEGITPYVTNMTYPQVIPIEFSKLSQFNWKANLRSENMSYLPCERYCEDVYKPLIDYLLQ